MRDAEAAKKEMQGMAEAAKAESAAEVAGATAAAAARKADVAAMREETTALNQLGAAAKATNPQLLYGGRSDMTQHLADLQRETQLQELLNRARDLGFTTPQQYAAWRMQMLTLTLQENRARFGGYLTPDQWLTYLQKEITAYSQEGAAIRARTTAITAETQAMLAYQDAVHGTHESIGQLGEGISAAASYAAALSGLPDIVVTQAQFDATRAMAQLAVYRAALAALPSAETFRPAVLPPPLRAALPPGQGGYGPATYPGTEPSKAIEPYRFLPARLEELEVIDVDTSHAQVQLSQWMDELMRAVRERYAFAAEFDDTAAMEELNAFMARLKAAMAERFAPTIGPTLGMGGAAGGGGGGPPPAAGAAPPPEEPADINATASALRNQAAAADDAAKSTKDMADELWAAAAAEDDLTAKARLIWMATMAQAQAAREAAAANKDTADTGRTLGSALGWMAPWLVNAANGWGFLNAKVLVFAGLLGTTGFIGSIHAWHFALDAVVETAIILTTAIGTLAAGIGSFLLVAYLAQDTLGRISDRMKAVWAASTATGQAIYPLGNFFDNLASKIRPQVWQLFGDALGAASGKMSLIGQLALSTGAVLDRFLARLVVDFNAAGPAIQRFLADGESVLKNLGQIALNVGRFISGLFDAAQKTHIAEDLVAVTAVLSKLLGLLGDLMHTQVGAWLTVFVLGLHGIQLWGGLAVTVVLNMVRSLALLVGGISAATSALGLLPEGASGLQRFRAILTDIAAGFGAIPTRIRDLLVSLGILAPAQEAVAASAGQAAIAEEAAAMSGGELAVAETAAAGATFSLSGALALLASVLDVALIAAFVAAIGYFAYKVATAKDAAQQWIDTMNQGLGQQSMLTVIGKTVSDLAATTVQLTNAQHLNSTEVGELSAQHAQLSGQLQAELVHTGEIQKAYGVNMPGALQLLQTAGVKTSDLFTAQGKVWAADMQQVKGLVAGYAAMGQGLTQLQGDVSVQLVMNSDQLKQMQALNTAWDQWLTLITGGESTFVTLEQNLNTTHTNAAAAGASMSGLNSQSLTLRSSFIQLIPQAGQVLDWLRSQSAVTQSGAAGTALLTGATRDLAAMLVPLAGNSSTARSAILALVQEADPSITTWKQLTRWIGPLGAAAATQDLQNKMATADKPLSQLDQDAAKLTTTLQQDLVPAMSTATFNALGGQGAFNGFATDLAKFGPSAQPTIQAGRQVAEILISASGNAKDAKTQFEAWMKSMGFTQVQADRLWAEVSKGEKPMQSLQQGLAKSADASDKLAQSGFWGQRKDDFFSNIDQMGRFFGTTLPHFFTDTIPNATAHGWSVAYEDFQRNFAGPLTEVLVNKIPNWFNVSLPHGIAFAWSTIYENFMRGFGSPVTNFLTVTMPGFFNRTLPHAIAGWGASIWDSLNGGFVTKVEELFMLLMPGWARSFALGTKGTWNTAAANFSSGFGDPVSRFFSTLLPNAIAHGWSIGYEHFQQDFAGPLTHFLTVTAPGFFNVTIPKAAHDGFFAAWHWFDSAIVANVAHFFTASVPAWFAGFVNGASIAWAQAWRFFSSTLVSNVAHFFTVSVPAWLNSFVSGSAIAWADSWRFFNNDIVGGMSHLFTVLVPQWFDQFRGWFQSKIAIPVGGMISGLGNDIETAFKAAINWVIQNPINGTINAINNVILKHLPGGLSIPDVPLIRAAGGPVYPGGGSVPGASAVDGTPILAMGGEYMLRQPARMALDRAFGPDFLNGLNQADQWLGAGSRGTMASQGFAAGGGLAEAGQLLRHAGSQVTAVYAKSDIAALRSIARPWPGVAR